MKNKYKLGVILALLTALISGFSNFIMKYAVTIVKDPIVFTTLKNSVVALLVIGLMLLFMKWREIKDLRLHDWTKLILIGIIGGSIPFILFFTGLLESSAVNANFIHKTLFIWVAILSVPFLKEKLTFLQIAGMGLLVTGTLVIGGFSGFEFSRGELFIVLATMLWAIENVIAKHVLKKFSALLVTGGRMVLGSIVLLFVVWQQGNLYMFSNLSGQQWLWTTISAVFLSGYVLTWYAALKRAPATVVTTLLVPSALITNILIAVIDAHNINTNLIYGTLLTLAGVGIYLYFSKSLSKSKAKQLKLKV
ncbi:MAG: DMT family transporter [bacterium]